ncbi:unnamed protein product [Vitrella brassicaformis CCMP3155]|uniref:Uncharacterized protein n=1 Tax=Vitrella brassicaformis (strain CCMP3155) TaxID=1169540 RepID=A0A0G4FDQ7_VITBC|nr:unnamed protein product [Vitrella brassicaformis CCMP3155]|eukprot:CEM11330.1 unnamed protein product [Vitrella brassicaformis CCMP3155]
MLFLLCSVVVLFAASATFDSLADPSSDFVGPGTNATAESSSCRGLFSDGCVRRGCKVRFLFELTQYWVDGDRTPRPYDPPRIMDIEFHSYPWRWECSSGFNRARRDASLGAEACLVAIRDTFYTEAFDGWPSHSSACGGMCMEPPQFDPQGSGSFAEAIGKRVCGWLPGLPPAVFIEGYVIARIEGDRCCYHSHRCCPAHLGYGADRCWPASWLLNTEGRRMQVSPGKMYYSCQTGNAGPMY